jgi:hypothetical protein
VLFLDPLRRVFFFSPNDGCSAAVSAFRATDDARITNITAPVFGGLVMPATQSREAKYPGTFPSTPDIVALVIDLKRKHSIG